MSYIVGDCPFCGSQRVLINDEHAFPAWTIRIVRKRRGWDKKLIMRQARYGQVQREYKTRSPEVLVKGPCKTICNGGWMHDLEDRTKPFLAEMMVDNLTFLDHARRTTLTRWAIKTAMVFDLHDFPSGDGWFTDADRLNVRRGTFPDCAVRLWAMRCSSPQAFSHSPIPMLFKVPGVPPFVGYCATMIIELVTLQLLLYPAHIVDWLQRLPTAPGPWERLVHIFPNHSTEPLVWPPVAEEYFYEDLHHLSRRFITGDTRPTQVRLADSFV